MNDEKEVERLANKLHWELCGECCHDVTFVTLEQTIVKALKAHGQSSYERGRDEVELLRKEEFKIFSEEVNRLKERIAELEGYEFKAHAMEEALKGQEMIYKQKLITLEAKLKEAEYANKGLTEANIAMQNTILLLEQRLAEAEKEKKEYLENVNIAGKVFYEQEIDILKAKLKEAEAEIERLGSLRVMREMQEQVESLTSRLVGTERARDLNAKSAKIFKERLAEAEKKYDECSYAFKDLHYFRDVRCPDLENRLENSWEVRSVDEIEEIINTKPEGWGGRDLALALVKLLGRGGGEEMTEKESLHPESWHGWDIGTNFEERTVCLEFTDKEGKTQVWEYTPRTAILFANLILDKVLNIFDMEKE